MRIPVQAGQRFQPKLDSNFKASWTTHSHNVACGIIVTPSAILLRTTWPIAGYPCARFLNFLRLSIADGRSHREIARAIIASPITVGEILRRAKLAGLTYPPSVPSKTQRAEPDWAGVHRELRRKGVTLDLLWQGYKGEHPGHKHLFTLG